MTVLLLFNTTILYLRNKGEGVASQRFVTIRIRVPQYTTLDGSGSVLADQWDGQGGGEVDNLTNPPNFNSTTTYVSAAASDGAEKGESIAGFQNDYSGGRYARGAPANDSGGGIIAVETGLPTTRVQASP